MLTKVEVTNKLGETLSLEMLSSANGYILEEIEGLDPPKASFSSSTLANFDGERYQSSRTDKRNIVISLGLDADYVDTSVRELRRNLYRYFMPRAEVSLRFFIDEQAFVTIEGRVESLESPHFVEEPSATISILCYDPYFRSVNDYTMYRDIGQSFNHTYVGDVDTGIRANFDVGQAFSDLTLSIDSEEFGEQKMAIEMGFEIGDAFEIVTVPGEKAVRVYRDGSWRSALAYVLPTSQWPKIGRGLNVIQMTSTSLSFPPYPHVEYRFFTRYGGI